MSVDFFARVQHRFRHWRAYAGRRESPASSARFFLASIREARVLPRWAPLLLAALLSVPSAPALAQGFAGLGTEAQGFRQPQRGAELQFPADHGPHPDFRLEWWYVTANLTGPDGTPYGLQWTLFRNAMTPSGAEGWESPQLWMGHAAVTTPDAHFVAERLARGGIGQAGVTAAPFAAWIDEWHMTGPDIGNVGLAAAGGDFAFDVRLVAEGPLVLHGDAGYSVKNEAGQASHYYSQPFYEVAGTLTLPQGEVRVTGTGWLDREWSSQPLTGDQTGWDWFSLTFDSGDKLMGYRLRDVAEGDFAFATWIGVDGVTAAYDNDAFVATPLATATVAAREVPVRWRVRLPDRGVDVTVAALNEQVWMDTTVPYWEGPVTVEGSHRGRGYLEMTGYEPPD